tara:strand:+ start:89 stop:229 length:141 start_codon:yes stop_codon:yes gene_type:complete
VISNATTGRGKPDAKNVTVGVYVSMIRGVIPVENAKGHVFVSMIYN